jgi:hypothetical protein
MRVPRRQNIGAGRQKCGGFIHPPSPSGVTSAISALRTSIPASLAPTRAILPHQALADEQRQFVRINQIILRQTQPRRERRHIQPFGKAQAHQHRLGPLFGDGQQAFFLNAIAAPLNGGKPVFGLLWRVVANWWPS